MVRVMETRPDDAFVLNNLGSAQEGLGRLDGAAQSFARASNLRPDHKGFAANAAMTYLKLGKAEIGRAHV